MLKDRYEMDEKSKNTKITMLKMVLKKSNNVIICNYIMQMKLNQCPNV